MKRSYRIALVLATGLAVMLPAEKVLANYNSPEARAQHDREQNEAERLDAVHMMAAFERNLRLAKRRLKRWQNRVKRDQRRLSDLEDRQKELQRAFSRYLDERFKPGGISKQTEQRLSQQKVDNSVEFRNNRLEIDALGPKIRWAELQVKNLERSIKHYDHMREIAERRLLRADRY